MRYPCCPVVLSETLQGPDCFLFEHFGKAMACEFLGIIMVYPDEELQDWGIVRKSFLEVHESPKRSPRGSPGVFCPHELAEHLEYFLHPSIPPSLPPLLRKCPTHLILNAPAFYSQILISLWRVSSLRGLSALKKWFHVAYDARVFIGHRRYVKPGHWIRF